MNEIKKGLFESDIDKDPFEQFARWYNYRILSKAEEPYSAFLGTSGTDGRVSLRTVLIKEFDTNGFRFYTNYNSVKSKHIEANPNCAILFYWAEEGRQVRIEGVAEKLSDQESESYFRSRPRESQLSAWASNQSSVIPDRAYLDKKYEEYKNKFSEHPVDKPPHWGGFILVPDRFEFWQEGWYRLHDRLVYRKVNENWIVERLAP